MSDWAVLYASSCAVPGFPIVNATKKLLTGALRGDGPENWAPGSRQNVG
jgi:hypothetical protein